MKSRPIIVGVTGGIGSGKSTICKIFEVLGCKTYYADDRAKWLMENNAELITSVKEFFGDEAYLENKLNRKFIADQAFKDSTLLGKLNAAVHPVVKSDFEKWIAENNEENILLKEAALLFETGSYKELDYCVLVVADEQTRIERVIKRDEHRNRKGVNDIIKKQMMDEEKIPLADFIIDNNGKDSVINQVIHAFKKLS